jgi:hypothetical protein
MRASGKFFARKFGLEQDPTLFTHLEALAD